MVKETISDKSRTTALIFSILGFFGIAGIHRFYAGRVGSGVLWLFTLGFLGIGTLVDLIVIANGNFKDKNNALLRKN